MKLQNNVNSYVQHFVEDEMLEIFKLYIHINAKMGLIKRVTVVCSWINYGVIVILKSILFVAITKYPKEYSYCKWK